MRVIKKEYGLLIIALFPILNLMMQLGVPSLVNDKQMLFVFVNILSVSIIVFYTSPIVKLS